MVVVGGCGQVVVAFAGWEKVVVGLEKVVVVVAG